MRADVQKETDLFRRRDGESNGPAGLSRCIANPPDSEAHRHERQRRNERPHDKMPPPELRWRRNGCHRCAARMHQFREMVARTGQVAREVARGLIPIRRRLRKTAVDDPADRHRHRRTDLPDRRRIVANDGGQRFDRRRLRERAAAREHLVQDETERELIGAVIRRHGRSPARATCSPPCPGCCPDASPAPSSSAPTWDRAPTSFARPKSRILAKPSLETIRFSGLRSRCTIPASCALARPSAICAAICSARRGRHRPGLQNLPHGLALDELHADVGLRGVLAEVVNRDDGGVIEGGSRSGFLLEPPEPIGVVREVGRQQLQRDIPIELGVARQVHFAHSPRAEERADLVRSQPGAGCQKHGRSGCDRDYSGRGH